MVFWGKAFKATSIKTMRCPQWSKEVVLAAIEVERRLVEKAIRSWQGRSSFKVLQAMQINVDFSELEMGEKRKF